MDDLTASPDPTASAATTVSSIAPDPTPEEAAAIVAAIQAGLATGGAGEPTPAEMPRWRFSGRWWTKPVPQRRDRP
ncbi:MAG: hypothetical protein U0Q07_05000 [Acidimicrobiales bacterium]